MPPWLVRVGRVLTAIEVSIGVVALVLIFGLVLLQAGQRYLPIEGVKFHPESIASEHGHQLLRNFLELVPIAA